MSSTPIFVGSAFATPCTVIDAISTDRTGAGTYDTVHVGIPSVVRAVKFQATTLTIDTMLLIFLYDGSTNRLIDEVRVRSQAPTNVDPGFSYLWVPPIAPLYLAAADELRAAMFSGSATLHSWTIGGNIT